MIIKAVITYADGEEKTFEGTPAVESVAAVGVDLTTIPTDNTTIEVTPAE